MGGTHCRRLTRVPSRGPGGHQGGEKGGQGWCWEREGPKLSSTRLLPGVCEGLVTTAGPPVAGLEPALTARPAPQSIPRAPSSDEECFFDLLSKFQSSRMDDQRCPLEEGQPAAAEATAAPTLEERIGEPAGAGAGPLPPLQCSEGGACPLSP